MTREEMYKLLAEKHKRTNWNNLASIKEYNQYARMLHQLVSEAEDEKFWEGKPDNEY